ncbi:DUF4365 domain-containing protein [Longispora sp. NPDC051575]|uniref:DUF4365 domain-containing protein n=1 Tax=Longispora sp. NPDC051575 TaxID=3154943 RepID=UPI00341A4B9B
MMDGDSEALNTIATLGANSAKSRFGVAYLRSVCSQAGIGFDETSPDEDVLAVDGHLSFELCPVRVQVKCTGQFRINGGPTATWQTEPAWHRKWTRSGTPVYFVLVIVDPDDQKLWLDHSDQGTLQRAAAFWARVDTLPASSAITLSKQRRLTAATLLEWATDLEEAFSKPAMGTTHA